MIGRTVSHYQIVDTLGRGGMGVVYKAIDINLGRPVALKFLSEELAKDRDAVVRFKREARASSALNDPGICTVYEIVEADGDVCIAMELLEGQTLHERLQIGAVPFDEALRYAAQLIDALHAAHTKGILHRDVKPGNIFLTPGGRAKLLDFGLAKIDERDDAHGETAVMTRAGTVTGTEPYMSPEQARGHVVDARSDLFSFGLVLSEMTTGRRVFAGSRAEVFDGILNRTPPPPSSTTPGLSPVFDRIVDKALQKDPDARYQTAAEFRADLKRLEVPTTVADARGIAQGHSGRRWLALGIAVAALVAVPLAIYFATNRSGGQPAANYLANAQFGQLTDEPGLEASPSLAPDGRSFVYASAAAGNWDIYWRQLNGSTATNLTSDSPSDDLDPAFAPDGKVVAFRSERDGGGIFLVDVTNGSLRRLSNFCHNPAWSPDQTSIVCATERVDVPTARLAISPLWILDVATGARRQLTTTDGVQPSWSPDGHRIAYWTHSPSRIMTVPAEGGTSVVAMQGPNRLWNPVWSADGRHLFYAATLSGAGSSNLSRVMIDSKSGLPLGPGEPITTPSSNAGFMSISRDGSRMTYVDQSFTRNFSRIELARGGDRPTAVTRGAHIYRQLDLSPDGTRLAFASDSKIFVVNIDGSDLRELSGTVVSRGPRWSPDGARIAFYSNRSGANQIWMIKPDGTGLEQVTNFPATKGVYYPIWSPDGQSISSTSLEGQTLTVNLTVPLDRRTPAVLPPLPMPGMSFVAWQWSPDGTRLAGWKLQPDGRSGGIAIYDQQTRAYRNVTDAGIYPTWMRGGKALLAVDRDRLRRVDLDSLEVTDIPTPERFASDFVLSKDHRVLYYAEDQREGNVWSVAWPAANTRD